METKVKRRLEDVLKNLSDETRYSFGVVIDLEDRRVVKATKLPELAKIIAKYEDETAEMVAHCILCTAACGSKPDTTKRVIKLIDSYDIYRLKGLTNSINERASILDEGNADEILGRVIDLYDHPSVRKLHQSSYDEFDSIMYDLGSIARSIQDTEFTKNLVSEVIRKYRWGPLKAIIRAMESVAFHTRDPMSVKKVAKIVDRYKWRSVDLVMDLITNASNYALDELSTKDENASFIKNLVSSLDYP